MILGRLSAVPAWSPALRCVPNTSPQVNGLQNGYAVSNQRRRGESKTQCSPDCGKSVGDDDCRSLPHTDELVERLLHQAGSCVAKGGRPLEHRENHYLLHVVPPTTSKAENNRKSLFATWPHRRHGQLASSFVQHLRKVNQLKHLRKNTRAPTGDESGGNHETENLGLAWPAVPTEYQDTAWLRPSNILPRFTPRILPWGWPGRWRLFASAFRQALPPTWASKPSANSIPKSKAFAFLAAAFTCFVVI